MHIKISTLVVTYFNFLMGLDYLDQKSKRKLNSNLNSSCGNKSFHLDFCNKKDRNAKNS